MRVTAAALSLITSLNLNLNLHPALLQPDTLRISLLILAILT